jgi:hypothetical protein
MEAHYNNLNKKSDNIHNKHKENTKTQNNPRTTVLPQNSKLDKNRIHKRINKPTEPRATTQYRKTTENLRTNLIMETERAIKLLDPKLQDPYRILAAKKIQQISNSSNQNRANLKRRAHTIKGIYSKLTAEKATIVRADKGKTIVIINTDKYTKIVHNFLTENNFHTLQNDPTSRDHKLLKKILQQCNLVIDRKQIKFLTQKNPQLPILKAQIKLHKPETPSGQL